MLEYKVKADGIIKKLHLHRQGQLEETKRINKRA